MDFIFYAFFALIGASVGSFVGVLVDRLPRGESIFFGRSHCDNCRKKLSFFELIPIISYTFLRGKCSKCKKKIPSRLFIIELSSALLYIILAWAFMSGYIYLPEFIFLIIVAPAFLSIFTTDLIHGIIPDQMLILILVAASAFLIFGNQSNIINHVLSAFGAGLIFFALFWLTRGQGMGFGDVKFSLVLGFILGFPAIIIGIYGAFLTGAIVSIILVLCGKKKLHGSTIPFGPFMVVSAAIAYFFGIELLDYFLKLF